MILTIDINPSIEREYIIGEISESGETISKSSLHNPSGKGVTIGKLLNVFNEEIVIMGFLGGLNGEYYKKSLLELGIKYKIINIKDENKAILKITSKDNKEIIISEEGPRITREELASFYNLYFKLLNESEIIIGSSSLPRGINKDIYFNLIRLSNKKEKIFILDAVGEELSRGLESSPTIVILNKKEFENLVKIKLNVEKDIIRASKYILDKGVKTLVINLGIKGILVLDNSKGYRTEISDVSLNIESLDNTAIVAAFAIGIKRNYDFNMILKLAQAFNIVYSQEDISFLDMSEIKKYMKKIQINHINY